MTIIRCLILSLFSLCFIGTANASSPISTNLNPTDMGIAAAVDAGTISSKSGEQYAKIRWIGDDDEDKFGGGDKKGFGAGGGGASGVGAGGGSAIGGASKNAPNIYVCPDGYTKCDSPSYGIGAGCNGLYSRCACPPKYKYDDGNCNGDFQPAGDKCTTKSGVKWTECVCKYTHHECSGSDGMVCTGFRCGNVCEGCKCNASPVSCPCSSCASYTCGGTVCTSCAECPPPEPTPEPTPTPAPEDQCSKKYPGFIEAATINCSSKVNYVKVQKTLTVKQEDGTDKTITCLGCEYLEKPADFECPDKVNEKYNPNDLNCGSGWVPEVSSKTTHNGNTLSCWKCSARSCPETGYSVETKKEDCPANKYFHTKGTSGGKDCNICRDYTCEERKAKCPKKCEVKGDKVSNKAGINVVGGNVAAVTGDDVAICVYLPQRKDEGEADYWDATEKITYTGFTKVTIWGYLKGCGQDISANSCKKEWQ